MRIHLGGVVCRPHWGWLQNFAATAGHSDCNSGLSFSAVYLRSKRGFLHSDVGVVVPTAVVGLECTMFPVEVAGRRLFVVVAALGTLVPLVQNMQCAAEVVVRIQAAFVPLYCPYLTWPVFLLPRLPSIPPDSHVPHTSQWFQSMITHRSWPPWLERPCHILPCGLL